MAVNPLRIETPKVSLIGGQQLPKASGQGVNAPDLSNAFSQLANELQSKANANRVLDDQLQGKVDFEAWRAEQVARNPNGMWERMPKVEGSVAYRAAVHDALNNNAAASIADRLNTEFGRIQLDDTKSAAERSALLKAREQGTVEALAPEYRDRARREAAVDRGNRENQMLAEEAAKQHAALLEGVKLRSESNARKAISILGAGGDGKPYLDAMQQAEDELVRLGEQSQETANIRKEAIGHHVIAAATQSQIATAARKGDVSVDALETFVQDLDVGVESTLEVETGPQARSIHPELDDPPRPKRKIISTGELRKLFPDPADINAVSANLSQLVNAMQAQTAANLNMAQFENYLRNARPNSRIPHAYEPTYQKVIGQAIEVRALDSPQGREVVAAFVKATKVMTPDLIDNMKLRLSSTPADAMTAIELWNELTGGRDGDYRTGDMIRKDMDQETVTLFDNATRVMQKALATSDKPEQQAQLYRSTMDKLDEPGNTVPYWKEQYAGATDRSLDADVQQMFIDHYSSWQVPVFSVPPGMSDEITKSFRINMSLNPVANPEVVLKETFEQITKAYQRNPIYKGGWSKGDDLSWNPEGYLAPPSQPGNPFGVAFEAKPNQWTSDLVKGVVSKMLLDGKIDFGSDTPGEPLLRDALDRVLAAGNPMPLGNGLVLQQAGPNRYEVWIDTGDGNFQPIRVNRSNGTTGPLLVDPNTVRANVEGRLKSKQQSDKAIADTAESRYHEIRTQIILNAGGDPAAGGRAAAIANDPVLRAQWLTDQSPAVRKMFEENEADREAFVEKEGREYFAKPPQEFYDQGVDDKVLMTPKAFGKPVVLGAVQKIGALFNDPIHVQQMVANIAGGETHFGAVDGTFRNEGDKGITQVNTGTGWVEVQRLAAIPGSEVYTMNEKAKAAFGIDITQLTSRDLDKPLVAVLATRMYLTRASEEIPVDYAEQGEYWRDWYNPHATDAQVNDWIAYAGQLVVPEAQAATGLEAGGPGLVTDMAGSAFPANFTATEPFTQTSALRLSAAFGKPLRVTPHGGKSARPGRAGSQHPKGTAIDVYIGDYSDAEKTQLISTAIAMGYVGIGGYGYGETQNTIHLDLRRTGGLSSGNLALWWHPSPDNEQDWTAGRKWFKDGITQGLARIGRASG